MILNSPNDPIKELTARCNGNYIESQYDKSQKAEIDYNGFKIIFDYHTNYISGTIYQQQFTRIVAPFLAIDNFQFELFRKDIVSSIETFFGAQDFEIGNKKFDKDFIIKTNNGFKTKAFLSNIELRRCIENQTEINLHISNQKGIWEEKLPKKEFELSFYTQEIIEDVERFLALLELFKLALQQLVSVSSIRPKAIIS